MKKVLFMILTAVLPSAAVAQSTAIYEYDALGRLVAATNRTGATDVQTRIAYDPAGNRTSYVVTGAPDGPANGAAGTNDPARFMIVPLNGFTLIRIR